MPPTIGPKIKNVSRKWVRATYPSLRIACQALDRPPARYSKKKVFLKLEFSYSDEDYYQTQYRGFFSRGVENRVIWSFFSQRCLYGLEMGPHFKNG